MSNPDYGTHFDNGKCTLTIEETFTEDTAIFTCKAMNSAGFAETSAQLVVKGNKKTIMCSNKIVLICFNITNFYF